MLDKTPQESMAESLVATLKLLIEQEKINEQLKAQVEQLRQGLSEIESNSTEHAYVLRLIAKQSLRPTPAQCLAERDYNIAKKAFINGVNYAKKRPDVILHKVIEMVAGDYAYGEQIRQAAKENT